MGLETGTYISDLVITNPTSSDPKSQGDDHLRLLKSTIKTTFPNVDGAMTSSEEELNILDGATLSTAELNILDGVTASTAELNIMDGVTATTTEINYIDGVTSAIQTQLDSLNTLKAPLASPALTGTPTAPTASAGASGTQLATLDFVNATGFASALPAQTGNSGKVITTDGTNASWTDKLNASIVGFVDNADNTKKMRFGLAGLTTGQTRLLSVRDENYVLVGATSAEALKLYDHSDSTKIASFQLGSITAGQTRTVTLDDSNMTLFTPGMRLLSTVSASNSATVDVETTFNSAYDAYLIVADGVTVQTNSTNLQCRFKIGGSYITTATYSYLSRLDAVTSTIDAALIIDGVSNGTTESVHFIMRIENPESTAKHHAASINGCRSEGNIITSKMMKNTTTGALTGVRFLMNSGNIVAGNFRLYGLTK